MTKKTAYISGAIAYQTDSNIEAFRKAEQMLKGYGLDTLVPHDIFVDKDTSTFKQEDFLRPCIIEMLKCDLVITLPDWQFSNGATTEVHIARQLRMPIYHLSAEKSILDYVAANS